MRSWNVMFEVSSVVVSVVAMMGKYFVSRFWRR